MDLLVMAGAPGTGKTTIARAIRARLGCPHIDMSRIREMYLDTEWSNANPEEAQMSFLLTCHLSRTFIDREMRPVLLDDLSPEHLNQISDQFVNFSYSIVSLCVADRAVLDERITDQSRDSGFTDVEAAWRWTLSEQERELLPNEVRVDTTNLSIEATCDKVCEMYNRVTGDNP